MERFDWLKCPFSSPVDSPHMKRAPILAPFSYADRFQLEKKSKEKKEERRGEEFLKLLLVREGWMPFIVYKKTTML
jgi:hypothetical protein